MKAVSGSLVVSHLGPKRSPTKLPLRHEAVVPVNADLLVIHTAAVENIDCFGCLGPSSKLHKTEPTGLVSLPVQAHVEVDYLATLTEQLLQLTLLGEE